MSDPRPQPMGAWRLWSQSAGSALSQDRGQGRACHGGGGCWAQHPPEEPLKSSPGSSAKQTFDRELRGLLSDTSCCFSQGPLWLQKAKKKMNSTKKSTWRNFCFGQDGVEILSIFLLLSATKPWTVAMKHSKKTLKGGEKRAGRPGTAGPEEWHSGPFPGFLFCLVDPRLGAEEASSLEMPRGRRQKAPQKAVLLGSPVRQELVDNTHSAPAKCHRVTCGLFTPCRQGPRDEPRLPPSWGCREPLTSGLAGLREGQVDREPGAGW